MKTIRNLLVYFQEHVRTTESENKNTARETRFRGCYPILDGVLTGGGREWPSIRCVHSSTVPHTIRRNRKKKKNKITNHFRSGGSFNAYLRLAGSITVGVIVTT